MPLIPRLNPSDKSLSPLASHIITLVYVVDEPAELLFILGNALGLLGKPVKPRLHIIADSIS